MTKAKPKIVSSSSQKSLTKQITWMEICQIKICENQSPCTVVRQFPAPALNTIHSILFDRLVGVLLGHTKDDSVGVLRRCVFYGLYKARLLLFLFHNYH